MRYRHLMPFGAQAGGEEGTRFRLWAPNARRVVLQLESAQESTRESTRESTQESIRGGRLQADLNEMEQGWYELAVAGIGAGARYCYRIDDEIDVPDPASRFNPQGVPARSEVVDPQAFEWRDKSVAAPLARTSSPEPRSGGSWTGRSWTGRDWHEAVIYELHVGTFTREGTYDAIIPRLDRLADTGITALELMPLAAFCGSRGWGYDGVLPFAPHAAYGRPEDLKQLIQAAHERELMVLLDVVYNHFGPEGNYLPRYAPEMFTDRHCTPWGNAIDFTRPAVREFFIHNALYWLDEYRFDGLRLDAVHAMHDDSATHFIDELVERIANGPGRERRVHVVLENGRNEARRLRSLPALPRGTGEGAEPRSNHSLQTEHGARPSDPPSQAEHDAGFSSDPPPLAGEGREGAISVAQWNDDFHHPLHVILTGERDGYYIDYAEEPVGHLGRVLAQGFAYQGERSAFAGEPRGEPSADLPPAAFVSFLQNHDQIGNRAFGERLLNLTEPEPLRAALAILLLSPQVPMLFMGEDYGATQPFLYFCDYTGELADAVRTGRRAEFAGFAAFADEDKRERIPDPNALQTFESSRLVWEERDRSPHMERQRYIRELLQVRTQSIVPLIAQISPGKSTCDVRGRTLTVTWPTQNGPSLILQANLDRPETAGRAEGELLFSTRQLPEDRGTVASEVRLAAWEVRLLLQWQ